MILHKIARYVQNDLARKMWEYPHGSTMPTSQDLDWFPRPWYTFVLGICRIQGRVGSKLFWSVIGGRWRMANYADLFIARRTPSLVERRHFTLQSSFWTNKIRKLQQIVRGTYLKSSCIFSIRSVPSVTQIHGVFCDVNFFKRPPFCFRKCDLCARHAG